MKIWLATLALLCLEITAFADQWPGGGAKEYWTKGKAEITRYKLTQSRYGELHEGDAVLIFVSEPFSRSKQVKLDDWEHAGNDAVEVLKLNFTKKFLTGVYPYSLMLSTFTPVDEGQFPRMLKSSMTGQEWCGHVFNQLNLRENHYDSVGYSYFESSGDTRDELPVVFLEDELWSRIRLTPDKLPTGEFEIIPGSFISRLVHVPLKQEKVKGSYREAVAADPGEAKLRRYTLEYLTGYDRLLNVYFENEFPYGIVAWDETYTDVGGKRLTTKAMRTKTLLLDYWSRHANSDREVRKQLDLPVDR